MQRNEFQKHYAKWRMPDTKSNLLYDSIYIVFWQRENYNNIKQSSTCQILKMRELTTKSQKRPFLGSDRNVPYLDRCNGCMIIQLPKYFKLYIFKKWIYYMSTIPLLKKFKKEKTLFLLNYLLTWQEENNRPCTISSAFPWGWAVFHIYYAHSLLFLNFYLLNLLYGHATSHARCEFTNQELNLHPLQWKNKVLTTGQPRKSPAHSLKECLISTKQILGTEYIKMNKKHCHTPEGVLYFLNSDCSFTFF